MCDIRYGGTPKDPKLCNKLSKHGTTEQLNDKSLTICSGLDYTNIVYQHIVLENPEQAKVIMCINNSFILFILSIIFFFLSNGKQV